MENMDRELTVPKWVLIVRPKIPQMPQNISAQNVCPSPKVVRSQILKENFLPLILQKKREKSALASKMG
jgi:hypothetical protein